MSDYKLNLFYQRKSSIIKIEIGATSGPIIKFLKKLDKIAHRFRIFPGEEYLHSF